MPLYEYLQNVQGYLSPAIAVMFILGVFWKRATAPGALCSFVVGVVAGFGRLALDLIMRGDKDAVSKLKLDHYHGLITQAQYDTGIAAIRDTHNGLMFDLWNIHWLYFAEWLFIVCAVLMIVISLMTKAPDPKTVKYTYYGATPEEKAATKASWSAMDVILSLIVIGCVVLFYIKFW
jgi:SSS family solute:Na+ symporter